jgi:outer membrane protein OmpA-like peptidoglycan-associated protein
MEVMMRTYIVMLALLALALARPARAQNPFDAVKNAAGEVKKAAGPGVTKEVEKQVNAKLTSEARKNQCSFKTDTDQLAPGCDAKLKKLANALVDAKRNLTAAGVSSYKFEVSGHTDSSGSAEHNKELSGKRAAAIARELTKRGVPESDIISVGMGSERPLVTPDNTAAKKAKNRRYEIQVRL